MKHPVIPELMAAYETKMAALAHADEAYNSEVRSIAAMARVKVDDLEKADTDAAVRALTGADLFARLHVASSRWCSAYDTAIAEYNKQWLYVLYGQEGNVKETMRRAA